MIGTAEVVAERMVERDAALHTIRTRIDRGESVLVHGPAGIGTSTLVEAAFLQTRRRPLWCRNAASGSDIYRAALTGTIRASNGEASGSTSSARAVSGWSSVRCRGLLEKALRAGDWCLVLDPAPKASRVLAHALQDLLRLSGTPLLACAISPHMEDIGELSLFFPLRSDRLSLEPLSDAAMLALGRNECARRGLPENLSEEALRQLLRFAQGRPGVLLRLLEMARMPRYWVGATLKANLLYVDFRMGGMGGDGRH